MNGAECVSFLQWALPRLRMRWPGFRRVRGQVCNRVRRRARALGLPDLTAYKAYLEGHPEEWAVLDGLTCITISRFSRDREVFAFLRREVLPALARRALARGSPALQAWSAGCASGEEPYTLSLTWELEVGPSFPGLALRILATDLDATMIARTRRAEYGASSLKELPDRWRAAAFVRRDGRYVLRAQHRGAVTVRRHDIRDGPPDGPFDLLLCRNLVFTYFEAELQREVCAGLIDALVPGGALVVGAHEALPEGVPGLAPWPGGRGVFTAQRPVAEPGPGQVA